MTDRVGAYAYRRRWGCRLKRSFAELQGLQPEEPTLAGGRRDQRCMCQLNFAKEAREEVGVCPKPPRVSILPPATRVGGLQHALVPYHRNGVLGAEHLIEILSILNNP